MVDDSMKIYFCGAITGNKGYLESYYKIMDHLKGYGEVITEEAIRGGDWVGGLPPTGDKAVHVYERDIKWLREADLIVADVTMHSIGVGFELGFAESLGKRVLCLYNNTVGLGISAMLRGNKRTVIMEYDTIESAKRNIDKFFNNALGVRADKS
jgi:hypothetical protein